MTTKKLSWPGLLRSAAIGAAATLAIAAAPALAQGDGVASYPNKPIRIIVPFAAGGGNDLIARLVGPKFSEFIGQTVILENKPGAGGRLGADYVMNQPHDGYTVFMGASGAMSIAAAIYPNLSYHPTKTYEPLSMIASFPLVMVIPKDHPARNVKELAEWAKKNPSKANYAATSPAFIIPSETLKLETGMPGTMIPYKSSNEMVLSVMQGQTLFAIADGPPIIPQVEGKNVRALAVTGSKRSPSLPDVPSMAEQGFPGVNTQLWTGFFVPKGTPKPIVDKLEAALRKAIVDPKVSEGLKGMAINPGGGSSAEFRSMIDKDIEGYVSVIKKANLKFN